MMMFWLCVTYILNYLLSYGGRFPLTSTTEKRNSAMHSKGGCDKRT